MIAAAVFVVATVLLATLKRARRQSGQSPASAGGIIYFISIGIGFMLVEMAMIQQLSIFLGHPNYSFMVVLGGLIFSTGLGSLISDKVSMSSALQTRGTAFLASLLVSAYTIAVVPTTHALTPGVLLERVLISLLLIAPCGFVMGFCFPVGMRRLTAMQEDSQLPWMWALNGAAGTLGSFLAILISMDISIAVCSFTGAACYLVAAAALPGVSMGSGVQTETEALVSD